MLTIQSNGERQRTVARRAVLPGIGLHSGRPVSLAVAPAPVDTGIVFVRTDLAGRPTIRVAAANVTATLRATTLAENDAKVFTVEHFMSAAHALGVDNLYVEMDAEEPPVADGSAADFFRLLTEAGIAEQGKARRITAIDRVYRVDDPADHERFILALPYPRLRLSFTSINPHPLVGTQFFDIELDEAHSADYLREIGRARTIAYEKEVAALREAGLGLGGTLENVIVYSDTGWLNELRYPDELVRHKILDLVGDLRLAGIVRGHIVAVKSSHELNTKLARKIAAGGAE